jgi:Gpi18-like mannosyltransferase
VVAIKIPSVAFDLVCAWMVYLMVALRYANRRVAAAAFVVVLLAPTVIANGAVWGQSDSIYSALLLACVYGLMTAHAKAPLVAFGGAIAFKFQSMFLSPCLCALLFKRRFPPWVILLVPAVYVLAMVPAWLEGRSTYDLATIYLGQSGTFHNLTRNAPNLYAWLPQRFYSVLVPAGLLLMTAIGCVYVGLVWKSKARFEASLILQLSLLSLMLTPFFLPKMHDRYFFAADVLSIAYGFYFPRQWFVPLLVSSASFLAYCPFLLGHPVLPLRVLSLIMGAAVLTVTLSTYRALQASGVEAEASAQPALSAK